LHICFRVIAGRRRRPKQVYLTPAKKGLSHGGFGWESDAGRGGYATEMLAHSKVGSRDHGRGLFLAMGKNSARHALRRQTRIIQNLTSENVPKPTSPTRIVPFPPARHSKRARKKGPFNPHLDSFPAQFNEFTETRLRFDRSAGTHLVSAGGRPG